MFQTLCVVHLIKDWYFKTDDAEEMYKEAKSSYFDLPALDVSIAFPQATPASVFPPCSKIDFYSAYYCIYSIYCSKKETQYSF